MAENAAGSGDSLPAWFHVLREDLNRHTENTRADFAALRSEVTERFSNLVTQTELERDRRIATEQHAAITSELATIKADLSTDIEELRRDFEQAVDKRDSRERWIVGTFIGAIAAAAAVVASIATALHH